MMLFLLPSIISSLIGEYCFSKSYFDSMLLLVNSGDSGNINVGLHLSETLVSVGVATIPTAGTLASLADKHPITTPPPITPTTPSAFSFLIKRAPDIAARIDFKAALNNFVFDAACPPAAGIGDCNHVISRFFK